MLKHKKQYHAKNDAMTLYLLSINFSDDLRGNAS